MTEKSTIIVKPSAARQFESFWERGKVLFFSAPCGIGKMALADTLLERYPVLRLHAGEASFTLPSLEDAWQTLLIDDLQYRRSRTGRRFVRRSGRAPGGAFRLPHKTLDKCGAIM